MTELKRLNGELIGEGDSIKKIVQENKINLRYADLRYADLRYADLRYADLQDANLRDANLRYADLRDANLRYADLRYANLRYADLQDANLRYADLRYADLRYADLRDANLRYADLEFPKFPSLKTLASINLGSLSDTILIEILIRGWQAHPKPELFDKWANVGNCPYNNEERYFIFNENIGKEIWRKCKDRTPKMADRDLIIAICKEKGWGIKNYLPLEDLKK